MPSMMPGASCTAVASVPAFEAMAHALCEPEPVDVTIGGARIVRGPDGRW